MGEIAMQIRWNKLAELLGAVTIVASLVFVGIQIRQDHVIARSELGAESFAGFAHINQLMTDPDFAAVWAKMLESPKDLTVTEMLRLNGFLNLIAEQMARECYLTERGNIRGM